MIGQDYEQLTLFPEDSHASHSPWLASKKEKGMIVTYGQKCSELSENLRRLGLLVRTYLEFCELPQGTWLRIWNVKVITSSCLILKLRLSERSIGESECSLWPTVRSHEVGDYQYDRGCHNKPRLTLSGAAKLWPTPKASDGKMGMTARTRGRPIEKSTHLQTRVWCAEHGLLPTPRVGGSRGNSPAGMEHGDLAGVVGGQLNPTWVEWLMGFPTGWSDLHA